MAMLGNTVFAYQRTLTPVEPAPAPTGLTGKVPGSCESNARTLIKTGKLQKRMYDLSEKLLHS